MAGLAEAAPGLLKVITHITKSAKGNGFSCLGQFPKKPGVEMTTLGREPEQRAGGSNFSNCKSKSDIC